jgi:hypothetical protein
MHALLVTRSSPIFRSLRLFRRLGCNPPHRFVSWVKGAPPPAAIHPFASLPSTPALLPCPPMQFASWPACVHDERPRGPSSPPASQSGNMPGKCLHPCPRQARQAQSPPQRAPHTADTRQRHASSLSLPGWPTARLAHRLTMTRERVSPIHRHRAPRPGITIHQASQCPTRRTPSNLAVGSPQAHGH